MVVTNLIIITCILFLSYELNVSAFSINTKRFPWTLLQEKKTNHLMINKLDYEPQENIADDKFIPFVVRAEPSQQCVCNIPNIRFHPSKSLVLTGIIQSTMPFPLFFEARIVNNRRLIFKIYLEEKQRFSRIAIKHFFKKLKDGDKRKQNLGGARRFSYGKKVRTFSIRFKLPGDDGCFPDPLEITFGMWTKICNPTSKKGKIKKRCDNEISGWETLTLKCIN